MSGRVIWMSGLVLALLAGPRAQLLGGEADVAPTPAETDRAESASPAPREGGEADEAADWPYLRPPGVREEIPREHLEMVRHRGMIIGDEPKRLVSLQELGSPHLPEGTPLENSEVDPELARVDPEELRQRYIALVETRRFDPSSLPRPQSAETPAPISRPTRKARHVDYSVQSIVALIALSISALAFLWLRKGPQRRPVRAGEPLPPSQESAPETSEGSQPPPEPA